MKKLKIKISHFNRYLILSIVFLFSYLFYLSLPGLYDQEKLKKQLEIKLLEEYKLSISLSDQINYRILPSPNFEVTDSILYYTKKDKNNKFGEIKKIKIFVSARTLYKQEKIKLKRIIFEDSVFNFNKISWKFLKNYFGKQISKKNIVIKKSKIFIKNINEDVLAIFTVDNFHTFFDSKKNQNKLDIVGDMFNTQFKMEWKRDLDLSDRSKFIIKFKELNLGIKNELRKNIFEDEVQYVGIQKINFIGSEININYKFDNKLLTILSGKSKLNNETISFKGSTSFKPFFFDLNIDLEKVNLLKLFDQKFLINNLLNSNLYLHNNFNGSLSINIDNLSKNKIFDSAKINIMFKNGILIFDDTTLVSKNFGNIKFFDSNLIEINKKNILRTKLILNVTDEKKFFQRFQIPKNIRKSINKFYFEIDKDLNSDDLKIYRVEIHSKKKKYPVESINDYLKNVDFEVKFNSIYDLNNFFKEIIKQTN